MCIQVESFFILLLCGDIGKKEQNLNINSSDIFSIHEQKEFSSVNSSNLYYDSGLILANAPITIDDLERRYIII